MPYILMKDKKIKGSKNVVNAFNNFLLTIIEKLHIHQVQEEDAITF